MAELSEFPDLLPSQSLTKGLIQLYTGNGKGKTSAALGVVLRAAGHGLRTHIIYFMKGNARYGDQEALKYLPNVTYSRFGLSKFVAPGWVTPEEKEQAEQALVKARQVMLSGSYDIVVLDEINVAVAWHLLELDAVLELLKEKPERVEIILTGRYADPQLIELADLVTEMVEIKHPFNEGILARQGVDY